MEYKLTAHQSYYSLEHFPKRYLSEYCHSQPHATLNYKPQLDISNNYLATYPYESALFFTLSFNAFPLVTEMPREENSNCCVYLVAWLRFGSCFPGNLVCGQMLGLRTFGIFHWRCIYVIVCLSFKHWHSKLLFCFCFLKCLSIFLGLSSFVRPDWDPSNC